MSRAALEVGVAQLERSLGLRFAETVTSALEALVNEDLLWVEETRGAIDFTHVAVGLVPAGPGDPRVASPENGWR